MLLTKVLIIIIIIILGVKIYFQEIIREIFKNYIFLILVI